MRQEAQRRPEEPADFSKSDHSWGSAWIEQAKALVGVAGQSQAVVTTRSYRTNPWSLPFSCSLFSLPFSFLSPPTLTSLSPFFDFLCRLPASSCFFPLPLRQTLPRPPGDTHLEAVTARGSGHTWGSTSYPGQHSEGRQVRGGKNVTPLGCPKPQRRGAWTPPGC